MNDTPTAATPAARERETVLAQAQSMQFTPYLPFAAKQMILDQAVRTALKEQDGIWYVDYIALDVTKNLAYLSFYTDFTMEGELPYDMLCELGVFTRVREACADDIATFESHITQTVCDLATARNALGPALARTIHEIIGKLPTGKQVNAFLNKLPKTINNLDPDIISAFSAQGKKPGKSAPATGGQAAKQETAGKKTPHKTKTAPDSDTAKTSISPEHSG